MTKKTKDIGTDSALKALKPEDKPYRRSIVGAGGLFVAVSVKGTKTFVYRYRVQGIGRKSGKPQLVEKIFTLGQYPQMKLAEAKAEALRIKKGTDPSAEKKAEKQQQIIDGITVQDVAEEWFKATKDRKKWSEVHILDQRQKLEAYIYPAIGKKLMKDVVRKDIGDILQQLEVTNKFATLKKVKGILKQILNRAILKDIEGITDWTIHYTVMTEDYTPESRAAVTKEKEIAKLMRAISSYQETSLKTHIALRFSAYCFCRPGEIRHAEWSEVNFEEKLWAIPGHKMKNKKDFLVPLSSQMVDLLERMKPFSLGKSKYVFTGRSNAKPMSEACILAALRSLGYEKDQMSAHGFRAMASTSLYESALFSQGAIERQLAHVEGNKVKAAYNRAEHLPERKKMMQWYSDFLDALEINPNY